MKAQMSKTLPKQLSMSLIKRKDFVIFAELFSVKQLKDINTGPYLYKHILNCSAKLGLPLTTDGTNALTDKKVGLVNLLNDNVKAHSPSQAVLSFHCIIHQESLCKSALDLKIVIDPDIHVDNPIRARAQKSQAVQKST